MKKKSQQESELKGRAYWECYSSPESMATTDKLIKIVQCFAPNCNPNYNFTEKIRLDAEELKKYFLYIEPKPKEEFIRILVMQPEDSEYIPKLEARGIKVLSYNSSGQRKIRLYKKDISKNAGLLTSMLQEAYGKASE